MKTIVFKLIVIGSALATSSEGAEVELARAPTDPTFGQTATFATQPTGIWQREIGEGFRPGIQTLSLEAGGAGGFAAFGGRQAHDFALTSVSYGYMLGKVAGEGHWYRGNWEIRGELFGGLQVSPSRDWLVGLTPHLRYNFATGTRWIPFADLGAGVETAAVAIDLGWLLNGRDDAFCLACGVAGCAAGFTTELDCGADQRKGGIGVRYDYHGQGPFAAD